MSSIKTKHSQAVFAMFREMKRLRFICDLDLKVGNEIIPVHRALLAASSDYFVKRLSDESKKFLLSSPMEIENVKPRAVRICLEFMYTGDAFITMNVVREVLCAATVLQLHGLMELCAIFLEDSLTIANCLQIREIAAEYGFSKISSMAEAFANQNFELVIRASGFQNLNSHGVVEFVRKTANYARRWNAVLLWTKGDYAKRVGFLSELMKLVVENCPFEFLFLTIRKENIVMEFPGCLSIITEAILGAMVVADIDKANCFELLEICRVYESQHSAVAAKYIQNFIAGNFECLSQKNAFRSLESTDLFKILESENAKFYSAEVKWEACTTWIKFDLQGRKKFLRKIMKKICWSECAFKYFLTQVYGNFLVKKSKPCTALAAYQLLRLMEQGDINAKNWFSLLEIAEKHDDVWSRDALEKILAFASMNFEEISIRCTFGKLRKKDVLQLLQSPAVKAIDEKIQWEGAMKWLKKDVQVRKDDLFDIFACWDLSKWPFQFLFSTVFDEILIQASEECRNIVIDCFLSVLEDKNINVTNCFELLTTAKTCETESAPQAIGIIKTFMVKNYVDIAKCSEFFILEVTDLFSILDSREFAHYSEEIRWTPIYNWLAQEEHRHDCLLDVLTKLRLERFSFRFLDTKVYAQRLVQDTPGCRELCVSAMLSTMQYNDISLVNWFELLDLAKTNNHPESREILTKIKQFMAANFVQIQRQAHFGKIQKEELLFTLCSPEIDKSPPSKQLEGIAEWIKADEARKDLFLEVAKSLSLKNYPFSVLFAYLTNGQLVSSSNDCFELFLSALQSVIKANDVTADNWYVLLDMAREYGEIRHSKIVSQVLKYLAVKFAVVYSQDDFNKLGVEDVKSVLRAPELRVTEEVKAQAVMMWVGADGAHRENELPCLFRFVKLEKLSKSYISSKIYSDPIVKKSDECHHMIIQALCTENAGEGSPSARVPKRDRLFSQIPNRSDNA